MTNTDHLKRILNQVAELTARADAADARAASLENHVARLYAIPHVKTLLDEHEARERLIATSKAEYEAKQAKLAEIAEEIGHRAERSNWHQVRLRQDNAHVLELDAGTLGKRLRGAPGSIVHNERKVPWESRLKSDPTLAQVVAEGWLVVEPCPTDKALRLEREAYEKERGLR